MSLEGVIGDPRRNYFSFELRFVGIKKRNALVELSGIFPATF